MRCKTLMTTAVVLAGVWAYQAAASTPPANDGFPPRPGAVMERMDANGDGRITYEEFRQVWEERIERRFERLDIDGDGILSETEIAEIREKLTRIRHRFREFRDGPLPDQAD